MKKARFADLGQDHRRGIAITLTFLDETLCDFEEWAKGRAVGSVLYQERNALSPEQRETLLSEITRIRGMLRELREAFGIERSTQSVAQAIWARCSFLRVHLVELEGRYLRRYGAVPPELPRFLDPLVAKLVSHLDRISEVVSGNP